jgi:hypothetical protein
MIEENITLAVTDVTVEKLPAPQAGASFIHQDGDPTDDVIYVPGDDNGGDGDNYY